MTPRSFRGGVHPPEYKELTRDKPIEPMPPGARLLVPLSQHLGRPATPVVGKGDVVRRGQPLAESTGPISSPVHAPVDGKVLKLAKGPVAGGTLAEMVVIEPEQSPPADDGRPPLPPLEPEAVTGDRIVERVREAGIVGLGGAAFPTAVKLSPPPDKPIDWLLINGAECEPYLTRDYRLMLERTADLVEGIRLLGRALGDGVRLGIGIEDNKPQAVAALREAAAGRGCRIEIFELRTKYPQGAEKMLIHAATGRSVPPGSLPMEVGCVIQNVGTALAVRDAVVLGEVPCTATLTVSGLGVVEPKNLQVPIGTPLRDVLAYCGGVRATARRVVAGGPMMGFAVHSLDVPVVKATSGVLVLTEQELRAPAETACIRCDRCVAACPIGLLPRRLARLARLGRFAEARAQGVEHCMECGTCAFTCPAHQPLVQYLRLGKRGVRNLPREGG